VSLPVPLRGMSQMWDVIVVGGGPAGMTTAGRAAERGKRVLLLEKNTILGKKLLISGGGRCNVTNATSDRHVLTSRYGDNGVHLHSLFARFGPEDTRTLLRRFGLETKVEAEGRVFPVTDSAASVRDVLERYMAGGGVEVRRGHRVTALRVSDHPDGADAPAGGPAGERRGGPLPGRRVTAVVTSRNEELTARAVVLATGGTARPDTGSTGDAFAWLRELGVPVRIADSALVPLNVPDRWVRGLQGVALPDAALIVEALSDGSRGNADVHDTALWANARRVRTWRGKLLFTHFGLSGPLALNAAADIRDLAQSGPIRLLINPLPGTDPAAFNKAITSAVAAAGTRTIGAFLRGVVLPRLAGTVCTVAEVDEGQRLATLTRAARQRIVSCATGMPCAFGGLMGADKAVVSSGGVDPAAVDFRTMRLREIPNLYVLGDLLDFNRQSGGYSLQMCWAGGWVAGESIGLAP
jgi:predicted Rossmann fold flavoprotein